MQNEQESNHEQEQQMELPSHVEVEGQKIYLGGLDYSLLQQEKKKQLKKGIDMNDIKAKLTLYADRLNIKTNQPKGAPASQQNYQNDPLVTNLIRIIKNKNHNSKPAIGVNTFYLFDTKYHFGSLKPQIITRMFTKNQQGPMYVHMSPENIEKFKNLMIQKQQNEDENFEQSHQIVNEDDSDDIFNEGNKKKDSKIEVGRKLDFGIKDDDLFGKYQIQPKKKEDTDLEEKQGKYQFLRKKVKVSLQNLDDGYGQCYAQTGPSLDQMKQLKKLGIQLFQDEKQFKKKERKVNIGKDYEKIKKIIEQRGKK